MADDILLGVKVQGDQATGFFRALAAEAQGSAAAIRGIGPAFAGVAQGIQALSQLDKARQAAITAGAQELQLLQLQIAIQQQARAGALSLADATRQLAEAEITAKTGSQQLAAELVAARTAHQQNAAALQAEAAAQATLKAAQTSARGEIAELQQKIAIQKQVLAGTLSLEQGTRKLAEAELLAKGVSKDLAVQLAALRGEQAKNQQSLQGLEAAGKKAFSVFSLAASSLGITVGLGGAVVAAAALVREGVRYNASLEQQQIGLASLVAATQKVSDAQGRVLEGAEKFNAAQRIASELMQQIQKDATTVSLTAEQINEAFQQSEGPLTAAGLSLQQAEQATIRIVQAASALGIPAHQIAQEVRAIAEGQIDQNARLANALGIRKAELDIVKQQGQFFEFINKKLDDFRIGAERSGQTFEVMASNIKEVGSQILGLVLHRPFTLAEQAMQSLLEKMQEFKQGLTVAFAPTSTEAFETKIAILTRSLATYKEQLKEIQDQQSKGGVKAFFLADFDKTLIDQIRRVGEELDHVRIQMGPFATNLRTAFQGAADASKVLWQTSKGGAFEAATAFSVAKKGIAGYATETLNAGKDTEKFRKELDALAASAKIAANNLALTQASITGNVEQFREKSRENVFLQFQKDIEAAQKLGTAAGQAIAAAADKMGTELNAVELKTTEFFIAQEKRKVDVAIAGAEARLAGQKAATNAALTASQSEIDRLTAVSEQEQRAGASQAQQATTITALNRAKAEGAQLGLQLAKLELDLNQKLLVVRVQQLANLQAQAAALQGKGDDTSVANLRQLTIAIEEQSNVLKKQQAQIITTSAEVAGAETAIGTIEIQRGESQVALTQQYLEEEVKRTQFAQEQIQVRADLELQGVQHRIDAITNQQGLEAATLHLREAQGAGLEEIANREKALIVLSQRRAQLDVEEARIKLGALQDELDKQHELIDLLSRDLQTKFSAGDVEGAKAVAGHLHTAATNAVELAAGVDKSKLALDNAKASAIALGIDGAAATAKLRHELELSRAVLTTNDARNIFSDILDAKSFKDAGKLLEKESKDLSKRIFTDLIFGKKGSFDEPLISNVNGLFGTGDGGLLGKIMGAGGKDAGTVWGVATTDATQKTLQEKFPLVTKQSIDAAHGAFAAGGTSSGAVFGNNCLDGFQNSFGDGIAGLVKSFLPVIAKLFGGSSGGGGGLFDNVISGSSSTAAGASSGSQFGGGFLDSIQGLFGGSGGGGSGLFDNVVSSSSSMAAGAQSGSAFGGGFMSALQGLFSGGGGAGGGASGGGLMGMFGGGGAGGGAGGAGASGAGSWFGLGLVAAQAGSDFKKGNYGAGSGAVVGGALGAYFSGGNPQATAAAAQLGAMIGKIFDDIFNKQGRIDKEKDKIIKYFEKVFDIDFKKITEKKAAQGLAEFADAAPAAKALGAIFSEGLKKGDVQGSTIRFAGQLLGNLRRMGESADEVKAKLLELADAANFDLHSSIQQINQFTKETGADALTLGNFQNEVQDAKKNLKEYGDTSTLTAAQLTELAAAHGNTGSQIVTYIDLIGGAIDISTRFNEFLNGQQVAQGLAAQSFQDAATAAGSTGQAVTDLTDKIRSGNLSLEEAAIALNEMRDAAGLAKLALKDLTIDPKKLEVMVAVLTSATEGLQNFSAGLTDALASGLGQQIDTQGAAARFDEFFNATLRVAVTKAMIGGLIDGLKVETLKPFFTALGAEFTNLVTGSINAEEFGRRVAALKTEFGPLIDAARAGFVEVDKTIRDVLTSLGLWPGAVQDTTAAVVDLDAKIKDVQDKIKAIDDQLLAIARRKIHVDIDLATKLESIGAITLVAKLDIEAKGLQAEFDLLTKKLNEMSAAAGLSVEQLGEAISLVQQLAANVVAKFQAEKAAIEAALATEIAAIRARGQIMADAIRADFAAQRAAIEARITALEKEKDAINKAFDARREALEKELQLAEDFKRVGESIKQTINQLVTSNVAPVSPFAQLSFLQRQAAQLREQLASAKPEDVPALMQQLSALLQQMAQLQTPNSRPSPEFQKLFNSILTELEALQAEAAQRGSHVDDLQAELKQLDIDRNKALDAIDAQITAARAQLDALSGAEQAALAAAAAGIEAEVAAAQAKADAKVEELRVAAAEKLTALADLEKDLLSKQEAVLLSDREILVSQLHELEKLNITAADLLTITAAGYNAGAGRGSAASAGNLQSILPSDYGATTGTRTNAAGIPQFLWDSMQAAVQPPRSQTTTDIGRPERVQTSPTRTASTSSESGPREVKFVFEFKGSVEVTGAQGTDDAAKKFAKSLKPAMETEFRQFMRSDYAQKIILDTTKGVR